MPSSKLKPSRRSKYRASCNTFTTRSSSWPRSQSPTLGTITYVNDTFCNITEYTRSELIGKTHAFGANTRKTSAHLWQTILAGKVWRGDLQSGQNRQALWLDASIVPYKNEQGTITQFVTIRTEITQRKKARDHPGGEIAHQRGAAAANHR